jgi:hypothetical protein
MWLGLDVVLYRPSLLSLGLRLDRLSAMRLTRLTLYCRGARDTVDDTEYLRQFTFLADGLTREGERKKHPQGIIDIWRTADTGSSSIQQLPSVHISASDLQQVTEGLPHKLPTLPLCLKKNKKEEKREKSKSPIQNPPPTTTSTIQNATHPHLQKLLHTPPLLLLLRPRRNHRAPPPRTPTLQHQATQPFRRKRRPRTSLGLLFRCARLRRKPLVLFRVHWSVRQGP